MESLVLKNEIEQRSASILVQSPVRLTPLNITKAQRQSALENKSQLNEYLPKIKLAPNTHQNFHKSPEQLKLNRQSVERFSMNEIQKISIQASA
jgi:hypothetical protein